MQFIPSTGIHSIGGVSLNELPKVNNKNGGRFT